MEYDENCIVFDSVSYVWWDLEQIDFWRMVGGLDKTANSKMQCTGHG